MSDWSVLEEGRARRSVRARRVRAARRRHRLIVALLVAAIALIALLIFMASSTAGPNAGSGVRVGSALRTGGSVRAASSARAASGARAAGAAGSGAPARTGYAVDLAPASERLAIDIKQPLTSGLVFDLSSGRVLWRRDAERLLPIASLTKMMTALVVVEHAPPAAGVLVTRASLDYSGSGVGLLPLHKKISVETMLYGLLLPSGNDAAIALAQHVAGTEQRFIALMNARARSLGLTCTHFTTVSGIVDRGNRSCAADLARLAHAVLAQPRLARIVASAQAVRPFPIKGGKLYLYNNNPLLRLHYPGADGVKTGFTDAAGRCLVATARRGRTRLGVVLLHSQDPPTQAMQLLDAGFDRLRGRAAA